jgi:DNA repair photolyase
MYPWVTHTHAALGGECPHKCVYCYGRTAKYRGPLRLIEAEMNVKFGEGKTIFIENCNDLFADAVPPEFIYRVLNHCHKWPDNVYVFQTKNPLRFHDWRFPENSILGCTIETNWEMPSVGKAPPPERRMIHMEKLTGRKFITIEPVLDFDVDILASWIDRIRPEFLNLGADSKDHHLPEPTVEKIHKFVAKLAEYGIELREKHNLKRLR